MPDPSPTRRRLVLLLAPALMAGAVAALPASAVASPPQAVAAAAVSDVVQIFSRSGRGDLVTDGNALLEVVLPADTSTDGVRVDAGGRDVSGAFRAGEGTLLGLVTELPDGPSTVTATLPDGSGARLELTSAPIGGPVFSGPQIEPWTCSEGAQDEQCNRPPTIEYSYKSTDPSQPGLQSYDPENPPNDVDTTTTDEGNEVPFIVREETGVSVRDEYKIAALYDPALGADPDPTAATPGFADKLVLTHGFSCDTSYEMGSAPDVLLEDALGQGFAVASHALDNAGHNCNLVTQAESLIVTKELVAERFGPIRYTIGSGCSGGSLVQQQVANAYPGVYQGITPQCSFTDAWSSAQQYVDYVGLRAYLESEGAAETGILPEQYPSIFGHANPANAITFTEAIPNSGDPSRSCPGVPAEDVYSADNPDGVRCSLQDYMVNVFGTFDSGPDAGKARRPISNVGVQYGLSGLLAGLVPPGEGTAPADPTRPPLAAEQFVALNEGVGGYDLDFEPIPERTVGDPLAQDRVYRSGAVNTGAHLDDVAILDLGGPEPGAFHDVYRKYAMRDRLIREHGTAENQVFWEGETPLLGDPSFEDDSITAMDDWLAVIETDDRDVPLPQKIIEAKDEAGIAERCVSNGEDVPLSKCDATVDPTIYSSPRIEAGGGDPALVNSVGPETVGFTDDRLDCQTLPIEDYNFGGRAFTELFTAGQQERLLATFPTGVCDYSKPGNGFQEAVTWLTYQDADGSVITGGTPMGPAPVSVPFGPQAGSTCDDAPVSSVTDRPQARGVHQPNVDCVLFLQIARGTTATTYSPLRPVTREQMASFLVRGLAAAGVPAPAPRSGAFDDVATSTHRQSIEQLAAAGIARGDGGSYDPSATLSRAQMASFIVRTAEFAEGAAVTPSRTDRFGDVPVGDTHEQAIAAGFEAGLFSGVLAPTSAPRSGVFAPTTTVLRDQMASFLINLHTRLVS